MDKLTDSDKVKVVGLSTEGDSFERDGFLFEYDSHSTASSLCVYVVDGDDRLMVWYKTNWCSSSYEFNEAKKVIGIQPQCQFCAAALEDVFIGMLDEHNQRIDNKQAADKEHACLKKEKYSNKVQRFKDKFTKDVAPSFAYDNSLNNPPQEAP